MRWLLPANLSVTIAGTLGSFLMGQEDLRSVPPAEVAIFIERIEDAAADSEGGKARVIVEPNKSDCREDVPNHTTPGIHSGIFKSGITKGESHEGRFCSSGK